MTKETIKVIGANENDRILVEQSFDYGEKKGIKSEMEQIKRIIDEDRDKGNIVSGGFSPALCLSKILKHLEQQISEGKAK